MSLCSSVTAVLFPELSAPSLVRVPLQHRRGTTEFDEDVREVKRLLGADGDCFLQRSDLAVAGLVVFYASSGSRRRNEWLARRTDWRDARGTFLVLRVGLDPSLGWTGYADLPLAKQGELASWFSRATSRGEAAYRCVVGFS
jgi:hypothetical protein